MEKEFEETKEQTEFVKNIYIEKAKKYLSISLGLFIFSFFTYIPTYLSENLDFGFYIELISLLFTLITMFLITKSAIGVAKTTNIISVILLLCLFVYDILFFLIHLEYFIFDLYYNLAIETLALALMRILFKSYKSLCKSHGDKTYEESTDWFYDKK